MLIQYGCLFNITKYCYAIGLQQQWRVLWTMSDHWIVLDRSG